MKITLGQRVEELRRLAQERGVADQVGDVYDPSVAIQAYADVLSLNSALVYDLESSLDEIIEFSKLLEA